MADQDPQTMRDWLSAQERLRQGGIPAESLTTPRPWWQDVLTRAAMQTPVVGPLFAPPQSRPVPQEGVEPLPLGSLGDPVSQAAFLMAPGLLQGTKATADLLGQPGYSRSFGQGGPLTMLRGERGNLGPPPVSEYGEALPRSVVRGADGTLTKLYHGTGGAYPDFEMSQAGSGAGGELYGPGIYLTDSPAVAGGDSAAISSAYDALVARRETDLALSSSSYHRATVQRDFEARVNALDLGYASTGRPRGTPNVRPVYADLKRPFDIDAPIGAADVERVLRATKDPAALARAEAAGRGGSAALSGMTGQDAYQMLTSYVDKGAAADALRQAGYDGITHVGGGTTGTAPHQVYIAFSPEHVYPAPAVEALK